MAKVAKIQCSKRERGQTNQTNCSNGYATKTTRKIQGYERMNLCDALESRRFLNGQMIIVQGDQANGMYFIESGVS